LLQTCLAGVILTLITGGALAALVKYSGRSLFPPRVIAEDGLFYQKMRNYDRTLSDLSGGASTDTERLTRLLDELEKDALGVESHLSVLKRRRALAAGSAGSAAVTGRSWSGSDAALSAYRSSAVKAAALFPHSEPLAAVSAEALIRSAQRETAGVSPLFSEAGAGTVRQYAEVIGENPGLAPAALSVYVLAGDMANPARALTVPGGEALLMAGAEHRLVRDRETLLLDAAILAALKNNASGAIDRLRSLLAAGGSAGKAALFGAELLYDFGDPLRAAELFSRFDDDRSMARQADALILGGRKAAARGLWTILAAPASPGGVSASPEIRVRSLYNLAAFAENAAEERTLLERLLTLDGEHPYGVIRYTRLFPPQRAIAILEDSALPLTEALADLEMLRRRDGWSIDRMIPEAWLLINRHPEAEALYQWAAYYFVLQRRYYEVPPLIRAAERNGMTGSWLDLQRAMEHIRQGRFDEAEKILGAVPANADSWEIYANLGRLLEAKRSYTTALENYETAASLVRDNKNAARIQLRIARCLRTLRREMESLKVLEYAQSLDEENLNIRLERERLEQSLF
jgi:tetratricopeptide (TPR) repeat protein